MNIEDFTDKSFEITTTYTRVKYNDSHDPAKAGTLDTRNGTYEWWKDPVTGKKEVVNHKLGIRLVADFLNISKWEALTIDITTKTGIRLEGRNRKSTNEIARETKNNGKTVNYKSLPHSGYLLARYRGYGPLVQSEADLLIEPQNQQYTDYEDKALWFATEKSAKEFADKYFNSCIDNFTNGCAFVSLADFETYNEIYKRMKEQYRAHLDE